MRMTWSLANFQSPYVKIRDMRQAKNTSIKRTNPNGLTGRNLGASCELRVISTLIGDSSTLVYRQWAKIQRDKKGHADEVVCRERCLEVAGEGLSDVTVSHTGRELLLR